MRIIKLFSALLKMNFQMVLAYRADTVANIITNLFWLGWDLLSLQIIFTNTTSLSGWGLGDLIALLGVFRLANTLMMTLIWPNTERFNASIRDGSFDYTLLQPINSQFLTSFTRIAIWRVWEVGLSAALIIIGINLSERVTTPLDVLSFLALTFAGATVIYSLWIVLIAFTFWFVKFDNNVTILQALMDAGRYPASVYPTWLRYLITFVIPIAVATTVPVQALRGDLSGWQVLMYLGIAAASLVISGRVWSSGVKRYSSASS